MSDAPHISHDKRDGWFKKVHRGHRNDAPASTTGLLGVTPGESWLEETSEGPGLMVWFRNGSGVPLFAMLGVTAVRVFALDMAAFRTWVSVGFIPQARHGGRGV